MVTHRLDEASNELGTAANNNTTITVDGQIRPTSAWDLQYLLTTSIHEATYFITYATILHFLHIFAILAILLHEKTTAIS